MRYFVADVQLDTILKRCLCQRFDQSWLPTRVLIDNPIDATLDTRKNCEERSKKSVALNNKCRHFREEMEMSKRTVQKYKKGSETLLMEFMCLSFCAKAYSIIVVFFRSFPNNQKMSSFYNRQKNTPNLVNIVVI